MDNKNKYKGTFNISGEVVDLYAHAMNKQDALRLLERRLSKKYGRKIFIKNIDYKISEIYKTGIAI